jgi:hypothetical protein
MIFNVRDLRQLVREDLSYKYPKYYTSNSQGAVSKDPVRADSAQSSKIRCRLEVPGQKVPGIPWSQKRTWRKPVSDNWD